MHRTIAQPGEARPSGVALPAAGSRAMVSAGLALLFVSALPDAMVVPVLKQLLVDRYGVSVGAAHLFMSVNILGAILAAGLVVRLSRAVSLGRAIAAAALLNGALLGVMALPIGFGATLALRTLEGAADLAVYAVLFSYLSKAGPASTRGRRMGGAATCMMLGIAVGMGLGGLIGAGDATRALWMGAIACVVVAVGAQFTIARRGRRADAPAERDERPLRERLRGVWPALAMMFADRVVAGVLGTTVPLYMGVALDLKPGQIGGLIGASMLMLALGAWPAGRLGERIGALRLRMAATVVYCVGVALLPWAVATGTGPGLAAFVVIGAAGAALFASSLMIVCAEGGCAGSMAAYHAAGNLGFFVGPLAGAGLLTLLNGQTPSAAVFTTVIALFAGAHLVVTIVALAAAARRTPCALCAQSGRCEQAFGG